MASYGNTVLTSAGIDLVKRVIAKTATFEITRVATSSDSRLTNATISTIEALTDLSSVQQTGKVTAFDTSNSKQVGIKCEFTNQGMTNQYNICGVGIYAKEAGKSEILFAVAPAKEPETMPAKPNDQSALFAFSLNMYVVVGQASAMSITATTEGVVKSINSTIKPDANGNVTMSYYSQSEVDQKISSLSSSIDSLNSSKANNTDVNALSSKVTNMQHDVASVKATVSNIRVSGRNLLRNSDKLPYSGNANRSWLTGQWSAAGATTDTEDMKRENKEIADPPQGDKATVISFTGILRPSVSDISLATIRNVPVSGNVTVSFWARQTSGVDTAFVSASWGVQKAADVVNTNASTEIWGTTSYPYRKLFLPKDGSWTRFWATFNVNDHDDAYIGAGNTGTSAEVQICLVKIETGTMATDWTPAPEDLEDNIDAALNGLQNNANVIKSVSDLANSNKTALATKANSTDFNNLKNNVYNKSTSDIRFVNTSGDTMSGNLVLDSSHHLEQLGGVVNFSNTFEKQASINSLINALRPLTGCSGSFNLTAQDGVLRTGWYNFIWMPHRSGGISGDDNGDYGTMLLVAFGGDSAWIVNYYNGITSIRALAWDENLAATTNTANAAKAKAEANANSIQALSNKVDTKASSADLASLRNRVSDTESGANTLKGSIASANSLASTAVSTSNTNKDNIEALKTKVENQATSISTQGQKISQNSIKITDAANAISSLDSKMARLMPQAAYVPVQVGDKTDLNNMKTCGFYLLQGGTSNSPVDGWTYVTVQGISTRLTQFVWKDLDPYLQWCRWYDGSSWTAWTQYTKAF